jgi:quaternary ammonium compound-resistance protein SugE
MPWALLLAAPVLEIAWAVGLPFTEGFTRAWPSLLVGAGLIGSFALLARAAQSIPIGTAYATWTGIGAAGTALFGMSLLDEPTSPARVASLAAIVLGVVGLRVFSGERS